MQLFRSGAKPLASLVLPLLALFLLSSSACDPKDPKDPPPAIEICQHEGPDGGADCVEADGKFVHKTAAELGNYWMTNQDDIAALTAWCYHVPKAEVEKELERARAELEQLKKEKALDGFLLSSPADR